MIRRSCNSRFQRPIKDGIKTTTIRDKPWPVRKPIMIFEWSGKPYRSKQIDIAPIIVLETISVAISRNEDDSMDYFYPLEDKYLWQTEGFISRADMDNWFRPLVKQGKTITKHIMRFRLARADEIQPTKGKQQ